MKSHTARILLSTFFLLPFSFFILSAAVPVSYDAPGEGFASVALFDSKGVLVRSLQYAAPVEKGTQSLSWDGTDDLGRVAPAGDYTVKGIFFKEKPSLKYGMTVGRSGNPPYRTPDGKGDWGANLGAGTGIAANSDSILMVFGCVEDNTITGVQRVDMDGNILRRYFTFYPWDCRSGAAMDDKQMYITIFNFGQQTLEIAAYDLDVSRGKILAKLPSEPTHTENGRWRNRIMAYTEGMALSEDFVYVSVSYDDSIFIVDRVSGDIFQQIDVPSPRGLAFHKDKLYAVSDNQVVRFTPDGKFEGVVVKEGVLKAPSSLAVDADGNLYVGDSGADLTREGTLVGNNRMERSGSRQIYVFDTSGKELRRIGVKGGTPAEGKFNPDGFGEIQGIAVDAQGRMWVNDLATGFKRNSLWSADGKLLQQWFCRKIQHTSDVVNPLNPKELLEVHTVFDDAPPGIFVWNIDFDTMTWSPAWFYEHTVERAYESTKGAYKGFTHGGFPFAKAYPEKEGFWPTTYNGDNFVALNGNLYMTGTSGNGEGTISIVTPDAPPKPVAMVGYHCINNQRDPDGEWVGSYDAGPNRWMTWTDHNGDGIMQEDEIAITTGNEALAPFRRVASGYMAPDGTMHMVMLARSGPWPNATLKPRKWLENGAPVYDWEDVVITTDNVQIPSFIGGDGVKEPRGVYVHNETVGPDGRRYALLEPGKPNDLRLPGIDGDGWWASRNWRKKLACFNADGTLRWAVGRRAPGLAKPGEMYNPMMLFGVAKDCVFASDAMSMSWIWHKDGFYVGRIFPDVGEGKMDETGIYVELMGNRIYEHKGKIYTMVNDTACAVHEVVLPEFTPIAGKGVVKLTPAIAAAATPWDPDGIDPAQKPTLTVPRRAPGTPVYKNLSAFQHILVDGARLATVQATYDDEDLYLSYDIRTSTGWQNSGTELPLCAFVSGSYVDVCFGTDWTQPQRTDVKAGDMRLLFAQITDNGGKEDFSQGYWPILPGSKTKPIIIKSPAAEAAFARIAPVEEAQATWATSYNEQAKIHITKLTLRIPLSLIGIKGDPAGKRIGFDTGVAVANEGGDQRERAGHWGGLSEARVVDRPGSAVLLPHTWGTIVFEE